MPEKFAALAGRGFEPVRHTAMHHRHLELGAQMMLAGLWMRPAYYGPKGDAARAIEREVRAVRESVGMIDVSTLGGLDIRGPDAAAFIDRMYTWAYEKQPVGRARYALMTDQTGVIIDDGVACRLHERHYLRHGDDRRRRSGLPPDDLVQCAVEARRRHRQRHGRLCRRQHRRPARARR